jgi:hypothetical protein
MSKEYNPEEFKKKKIPIMFIINRELGYLFGVVFIIFLILLLAMGIKWAVTYLF